MKGFDRIGTAAVEFADALVSAGLGRVIAERIACDAEREAVNALGSQNQSENLRFVCEFKESGSAAMAERLGKSQRTVRRKFNNALRNLKNGHKLAFS